MPAFREAAAADGATTSAARTTATMANLGRQDPITPLLSEGRPFDLNRAGVAPLRAELFAQAPVPDLRVRLSAGFPHHLADEEPDQALLPAPVLLALRPAPAQHPV